MTGRDALIARLRAEHWTPKDGWDVDTMEALLREAADALSTPPPADLVALTASIDDDGDLCVERDEDNNNCVSLTIYRDGKVGYSALVNGQSACGVVRPNEPMPEWVRDFLAAPDRSDR